MNTVKPISSTEAPILLPCGDSASLRELIAHHRAALTNIDPVERGRLHLTIGAYLGKLGADSRDEAIEEIRQAIDLLSEERSALDQAVARTRLGALLLEQAIAHGLMDRSKAARSAGEEAAYYLEQAHHVFVDLGPAMSRVEAARRFAYALGWYLKIDKVYEFLDRERFEHDGEARQWLELFLAEHVLDDPDATRQKQGLDILADNFAAPNRIPNGADEFVMDLLRVALSRLPDPIVMKALQWAEQRDNAPIDLVALLRSKTHPDEPELWMSKSESTKMVETMDDATTSILRRSDAARNLLRLLPMDAIAMRRRAAELLESWIDSNDINTLQKMPMRHDLAIALMTMGKGNAVLLERAVRHLDTVLDDSIDTPSFPGVARNLAHALVELLEARCDVSSPELVPIALRVAIVTRALPADKRKMFRLVAVERLIRWSVLTHPLCMRMAMELLHDVLDDVPKDPDGAALMFKSIWILDQQGRVEEGVLDQLLIDFGDIPRVAELAIELRTKNEFDAIAQSLSGQTAIETINLHLLVECTSMRPDAADLVFEEIERRVGAKTPSNEDLHDLLQIAIQAVSSAPSGDEAVRGKRLAALFLKCEKSLGRVEMARLANGVRCPATDSMREELGAHGISLDKIDESVDVKLPVAERVSRLQRKGIDLMQEGRAHLAKNDKQEAARVFQEACTVLDQALALASSFPAVHRATIQTSAGNARKLLAQADSKRFARLLDEADALYVEAWPWTEKEIALRAQLAKVRADGLRMRQDGTRWDEMMNLYRIALEGRPTGFLRWETLWEVANAELACPKRPRAASVLAALSRLDEACRYIGTNNAQDEAKRKMTALEMLKLLQEAANINAIPQDERKRIADRIVSAAPEFAHDARLAARGLVGGTGSGKFEESGPRDSLSSKFVQAVAKATSILHMPSSIEAFPPDMRELVKMAVDEGKMHLGIKRNDVESLHAQADCLQHAEDNENAQERAGRLVGRAMILSRLEELGLDVLDARRTASLDAEKAVYAIEDLAVRGTGLSSVSGTWQHLGPGGDFKLATRLSREALDLIPEACIQARADATNGLARANRYRTDIPHHEAIAIAIPVYHEAIELYRQAGTADGIVAVQQNLAEAVGARQDRPRAVALREGLAIEQEAIPLARSSRSGHLAQLLGNHAYGLTLLAQAPGVLADERKKCLDDAGQLFEEAFQLCTDAVLRKNIENNHLIWRTAIGGEENRGSLLSDLRKRLNSFDCRTQPHEWSMAAHNLADELYERHRNIAELLDARKIFEESLALRPENGAPKYHWETAERLGELLAFLYNRRGKIDLRPFRLNSSAARNRAMEHVRSALRAARSLGPGHRLTRSARYLGLLSADVDPVEIPDLALAAESMTALDEVLSLVPEDRQAGETEAEVAAAIVSALALHRAKTAVVQAVTSTGATALHGGAAWEVLHWMLRAHGGQHRRLRARMAKPDGVSPETWTLWRLALRKQDNWDERKLAFQAVRSECSSFLSGEPNLSATMDWMKTSGGAAAMLLETPRGWLLGVLTPRTDGAADASVVLLRAEPTPFALPDFLQLLRAPAMNDARKDASEKAQKALEDAVRWIRVNVLPDLRERLPENTPMLLWSPHGLAAGVPFGMVWNDLPSIWTTPCLTRPPPTIATDVRPSSLLVLAEPTNAPAIDGAETMARIARGLRDSKGRVEALFGQGRDTGLDVAGVKDVPGLLNVAPTPNEVKRRLADHRLVVILAHGQYDDVVPERSALALIGPEGKMELLTAESLAETPDLLRGSIVVLLSCETGAAGALSAAPAGLAGVLLAVGAAAVVAPLWIVFRKVALLIGEHLAADIAYGYDIGKALKWATEKARLKNADSYHAEPFVVWTG